MRHTVFVIISLAVPAMTFAQEAPPLDSSREVQAPAAPGFGGDPAQEQLLQRLDKLEKAVEAQAKQTPPATAEDAAAISASLQETQQRLAQVQEQLTSLQARDDARRRSATDRAAFSGEAINALQLADSALYYGEDDDLIATNLAAASVALEQAVLEADRSGKAAERDVAAQALDAVNDAVEAVDRSDGFAARTRLAAAYRRAQQARTMAAADGD